MSGARLQVFGRGGEQRHAQTVAPFIGIQKTLTGDLTSQRGITATPLNPDKTRWGIGTGTYVSGFKQVANRLPRGTFIIEPGCRTVRQTDPSVVQTVW